MGKMKELFIKQMNEEMENFIKVAEHKINESDKKDKKDEITKTRKDISTAEKRILEYKNLIELLLYFLRF